MARMIVGSVRQYGRRAVGDPLGKQTHAVYGLRARMLTVGSDRCQPCSVLARRASCCSPEFFQWHGWTRSGGYSQPGRPIIF
jgi:hypothetical protein